MQETPPATARLSGCGDEHIDYTAIAVSSDPRIVRFKDLSKVMRRILDRTLEMELLAKGQKLLHH